MKWLKNGYCRSFFVGRVVSCRRDNFVTWRQDLVFDGEIRCLRQDNVLKNFFKNIFVICLFSYLVTKKIPTKIILKNGTKSHLFC